MKISKIKFILVTVLLALMVILPSVPVYAAPTVTIISPSSNGFYLQYSDAYPSTYFRAYVSGSPTSVKLYYSCRAGASDNTWIDWYLCDLLRDGTTNYYHRYVSFGAWAYPRLYFPLYVYEPMIKVIATDSTGSTTVARTGTICLKTKAVYQSYDSTFYFTSETSNSLRRVWTGSPNDYPPVSSSWCYNCMAYALNMSYYGWMWPWTGNPSDSQLVSTMSSYGYNTSSKTMLAGTQIIYYSGGHFSRVVEWNGSTGMPTKIQSKWGGWEEIYSLNPSPFSGTYGPAYYYFKQ